MRLESSVEHRFSDGALIRFFVFNTLSHFLVYPDKFLLESIIEVTIEDTLKTLGEITKIGSKDLSLLERMLPNTVEKGNEFYTSLRVEYSRLFYSQNPIGIYANDYANSSMKERQEIQRIIKRTGLTTTTNFNEPIDHAACMMDYLSYLSQMEYLAWQNDSPESAQEWREESYDFWELHAKDFMFEFSVKLNSCSKLTFYKFLAIIIQDCVKNDIFEI